MLANNDDSLHMEHTASRSGVHSMPDGHSRTIVKEVLAMLDKFAVVQVPAAAQWLQQYYTAPTEGPIPMGSGEEDNKHEDAESATPSKQEQFKQAAKADKEAAEPKPAQVIQCPADRHHHYSSLMLLKDGIETKFHTC